MRRPAREDRPERQQVVGLELTAKPSAHLRRQVRRSASEHRRHCEAPGDSDKRPRALLSRPERQPRSLRDAKRTSGVYHGAVYGHGELRAGDCNHAFDVELQLGAAQGDFETGVVGTVTDKRIRQPARERIHRARHRNATALKPPASQVLDRGLQSGPDNKEGTHAHTPP